MPVITIPVDAHFITLERREMFTDRVEATTGGFTQTQFLRKERTHTVDPGWNVSDFQSALSIANAIWEPAGIRFRAGELNTRSVQPPMDFTQSTDGAYQYLLNHIVGQEGRIAVLLVPKFPRWDQGGDANRGTCIVPSALNMQYQGRAFAHEFGHLLGLEHLEADEEHMQNLMLRDLTGGIELLEEQVATARQSKLAQNAIPANDREEEES